MAQLLSKIKDAPMRWLYAAIIASSALLMRGAAIGQAVDVSLYGATPNSGQNSSPNVARAIDFALRHHRSRILSNEEGMTFGRRARLYATFLSQTMMEWPSARLP
jgi:hypothetical protein